MKRHRHFLLAGLTALLMAAAAHAQSANGFASLLADRVELGQSGTLLATGNVEILYGNTRLTAASVTYDPDADQLRIAGPIMLSDGDADAVLIASAAELDEDMRNGILHSARMVLDEQLQIAASELRRIDGRYTQLFQTVASTCRICANGAAPLWQIRAESIVHDQERQRLYFTKARFEVGGVPVAYLPRLSMPDPTARRANGILAPRFSNSSRLGPRVEQPYFITLGDHADITLAPALSPNSRSLGLLYRRAFAQGTLEFDAAITDDDLAGSDPRGFAHLTSQFDLPNDFALGAEAWWVSDTTYAGDYGVFTGTRLPSSVTLDRTTADTDISVEALHLQTLRGAELAYADRLPSFIIDADWTHVADARPGGGMLTFGLGLEASRRNSGADILGRDSLQVMADTGWARSLIIGPGVELETNAGLAAIAALYADDAARAGVSGTLRPSAAAVLRWPLIRRGDSSVTTVQPVLGLGWAGNYGKDPVNEDSLLNELDFGNIFQPGQHAGNDRARSGAHVAGGVSLRHEMGNGAALGVDLARLWQADPFPAATAGSGLSDQASDWIIGSNLEFGRGFGISADAQIEDTGAIRKSAAMLEWQDQELGVSLTHIWLAADPGENRDDDLSELSLDAMAPLWPGWTGSADLSYDLSRDRPIRAGLELNYRTECVRVDLSLSRRFTSSGNVLRDTNFGLEVSLVGFGSDGRAYRRACYDTKG